MKRDNLRLRRRLIFVGCVVIFATALMVAFEERPQKEELSKKEPLKIKDQREDRSP